MTLSAQTLAAVLSAMPATEGVRPNEVHKALGRLSGITVRHALRELVAAGRVEATGPDCNRRYRRKAAA